MNADYDPQRDLGAKITRRVTQWRAAAPARITLSRPILTLTFDDFPVSAARAGAEIVEAYGACATFYASAGLRGESGPCGVNFAAEDLLRLAAAGHEIGSHGFDHRNNAQLSTDEACADYARNLAALVKLGHRQPLQTLAFPYGETHVALKRALARQYSAARGIMPGVNAGRVDRMQLRAFPFYGDAAFDHLRAALTRAHHSNGWLIAFTHDVSNAPSPYGATPRALKALLAEARRRNFQILPLAQAAGLAFKHTVSCAA